MDGDRHDGEVGREQVRGSALLLAGQAFSVLVNLAVQLLIVRYLAKSSYGAFAYALSAVAIAQTVAAFGLRHGVSRFMPLYEERRELAKAAGTLALAAGMVLSLGLAVVLVVVVLRDPIAGGIGASEAVPLLTVMIFLAPLLALATVLDGVFAVFSKPRAIVVRRFVVVPLLRLVVAGVLIATASDVLLLAWGYLAVEVIGLAVYAPMLIPLLRRHGLLAKLRPSRLVVPARRVLSFTVPLFTNDLTATALNFAPAIVVGALVGAAEVASLRAVFPIALTMGYVYTSFGTLFLPLASRLHARGETAELNRLYWRTATWTTLLAYPILAVTVILAEPLTELLFGARYADSAPVLAVLALGLYVNTATGYNGLVLGVFDRVGLIAATNLVALAVNLGLAFALVPEHGAVGAAVAISAAYLVMNGLRQLALVRHTPVQAVERSYLALLGVVAAATAGALAVAQLADPSTPVAIATTLAACVAVFASVHRHLRLLDTFPELANMPLVGAWLRRRRGRG